MENERQALYSQLYAIESDLSVASASINKARTGISQVDGFVGSLSNRLKQVRVRGYLAMSRFEKDIEQLTSKWMEISPTLRQALANNVEPLAVQVSALQAQVQGLRSQIDSGNMSYGHSMVSSLSASSSSLRNRVNSEATRVNVPLNELFQSISNIDGDLKLAENTMELFAQAAFPMKQEESPVLAVDGKLMKGDKSEGTLYFTNQRFIFEAKKEVVVEKKFFIATKKKTERTVVIDQPIGAVQEITKGRVGLIAWTGIYVKFKPGCGQQEAQFDVEGWEADTIGTFFDYLINGEADKDIDAIRGIQPGAKTPTVRVLTCSRCYAPYTREIFRGQKSVQCDYCGAQIVVE